jgi:hypothetical protein
MCRASTGNVMWKRRTPKGATMTELKHGQSEGGAKLRNRLVVKFCVHAATAVQVPRHDRKQKKGKMKNRRERED